MSADTGPPRPQPATRRSGSGVPPEALAPRSTRRHAPAAAPAANDSATPAAPPPPPRPTLASAPITQLRQNRVRINVRLPDSIHQTLASLDPNRASFLMDAYHHHSAAIASHQVPHPGPPSGAKIWGVRISPAFRARLLALAAEREWTLSALLRALISLELAHHNPTP